MKDFVVICGIILLVGFIMAAISFILGEPSKSFKRDERGNLR